MTIENTTTTGAEDTAAAGTENTAGEGVENTAGEGTAGHDTTDAGTSTPGSAGTGTYTDDQAYRLAEINARVEAKPEEALSDEDQALWEAGQDGQLQPKTRPEGDGDDGQDGQPAGGDTEFITAAMAEVGAKTAAELVDKIKGLRQFVSGREGQAFAAMEKQVSDLTAFQAGETQLYADAAAGKPEALKCLEERGLRVVPIGAGAGDAGSAAGAGTGAQREALFSADDDAMVGGGLTKLQSHYEKELSGVRSELQAALKGMSAERETRAQKRAEETARNQVVDEMMDVAQLESELKGLPELKNRLVDYLVHGKDDAQLAPVFGHLMQVAAKEGMSLKAAYYYERGKNADALIAKAREEGVKRALGRPENKSMSGVDSRDEAPGNQTVTETQLAAFEAGDLNALPDSWFNAEGDFVKAKIPPKFHERLGLF